MPRDDDREYRDDYDDRPRRRKSSGSSSGLVIGLVVGAVFLVLLCGGVLAGLLLPAVQKVREAAGRMQDQNNMKVISLGFHNDSDAKGALSALARDSTGKPSPGLSWRVSLLPHLEQQGLYSSFDLTQSWDSPRNQPHSNVTIKEYRTPYDQGPGTGTPYRVFVGGGALFEPDGKPVKLTSITDGAANTILCVHATEQVPWAQPKEFPYSPTGPLPSLGHPAQPNGSNVAMADGSVRFMGKNVSENVLRAAITRAGGEIVPLEW